ncbi:MULTISPECIES: hypothetical protein [Bacillaceae]|nr:MULTISPECIES: hypothetical protein [Bacillaceae]MDT2046102.1 hypothetical protein [Priestia flexa]USY53868.1 hypothetical protein NIZ91_14030 [Bacillus sp. 1780r2a1]
MKSMLVKESKNQKLSDEWKTYNLLGRVILISSLLLVFFVLWVMFSMLTT